MQRFVILLPLLIATAASAEVVVTIDRNVEPSSSGAFRFERVPPPRNDDAATDASLTLVGGEIDRNAGELDALTDGILPTLEDQPMANLFFRAGSWGGRVCIDLGEIVTIEEIHTYSWHPSTRGPQLYKLYAGHGREPGFDPMPPTDLDPPSSGWTLLAFVDTRDPEGNDGGQYGVSITDTTGNLGSYRYLLLDAFETEQDDPWGNTFYSELDVITEESSSAGWSHAERRRWAERVRNELLHSWRGYERHAWGHDELKPMSRVAHDWHAESLLMTPVDTLDTLLLIGLGEEAEKAKRLIVENLSFDKDVVVKNFEITIRILGGLLSAYEITGDERLLDLADDLGTRLLPVFDSPTGLPYMYVNLKSGEVSGKTSNPAEIGTLLLEFGTLSRHTGKPIYFEKAKRALVELYDRRSEIGLVGEEIDVETGEWVSNSSHVGGGIDSYYEYLLKCSLLFQDEDCNEMWQESIRALNEHVADQAESGLWYGEVEMESGERIRPHFGALHAFLPAVLALGGDLHRAKALQASSLAMWNAHGIEPEVFDYVEMRVVNGRYPLRPEIIESAYYLHQLTGDPRYLDMGRRFFEDLVEHCRTDAGYTVLNDVIEKKKGNLMPSYFLAETLKYLYLLFEPEPPLGLDDVVFNTEAHPFEILHEAK